MNRVTWSCLVKSTIDFFKMQISTHQRLTTSLIDGPAELLYVLI